MRGGGLSEAPMLGGPLLGEDAEKMRVELYEGLIIYKRDLRELSCPFQHVRTQQEDTIYGPETQLSHGK